MNFTDLIMIQDKAVGLVTRLLEGQVRNYVSIPGRRNRFFCYLKPPYGFRGPTTLLFNRSREEYAGLQRLVREENHAYPPDSDTKNK
jgi:hypothetical protein